MPHRATLGAVRINGSRFAALLTCPGSRTCTTAGTSRVTMMLDAGQTQTMDVSYRAKTAADVLGPTR